MVSWLFKEFMLLYQKFKLTFWTNMRMPVFILDGKNKICRSIVVFNPVLMMDNFTRRKIAPKLFLHDKAMLTNVIIIIGRRMTMFFDENISITIYNFATLPIISLRAFLSKGNLFFGFFRAAYTKINFMTFFKFGFRMMTFLETHIQSIPYTNMKVKVAI